MTICTRVARNGLSYSGSTERASRPPRCVQTFLMATRNRAHSLFPFFLSPPPPPFLLFFPFIYRWYDHLRRDCVKWTLAPMPSFRSIEIRAFEKVRLINGASAKNLYFSFSRLIKTVEKSRKYLIFARAYNKKRERSVKRESARFLPIFRVYSSKKNLFLKRFYKIFR